jgi:hypothetical protein
MMKAPNPVGAGEGEAKGAKTRAPLLGFSILAAAAAIPTAVSAAPPHAQWVLDDNEKICSLSRMWSGDAPATLVVKTYPGSDLYDVLVASSKWPAEALQGSGPTRIELLPSGPGFERSGRVGRIAKIGQRVIAFGALPSTFLSAFAKASAFAVTRSQRKMGSYDIPGADAAVRALRACEDATLIAWGADPAGLQPGATRPRPIGNSENWLNTVRVMTNSGPPINLYLRLVIGTDGRVENCDILETARSPVDSLACLFLSARYEPGRDPSGHPVRSVAVYHAQWD